VRGIFYGWVIVAAAFTVMLTGFGVAYMFAAFFESFERDFQASRGDISLVFSICGFLYFMLGAASGPAADRYGPRKVIGAGMLLIAAGLALGSQATSLWQVYVTYSVAVGIGVGMSYVPAVAVVTRWFARRRGFATGIAVSGIGVGTMLGPPLADVLIAFGGWRWTYAVLSVVTLVAGLGAATLLFGSPQSRGLYPDGDAAPPGGGSASGGVPGWPMLAALKSRTFIIFYIAATFLCLGLFAPFVHLVKYAADHGYSGDLSVYLVSMIGLGSMLGRFVLGGAADRFGRLNTMVVMFFGLAVMDVVWLMSTGIVALALFAVAYGLFYGGFVALSPALITDYFGGRAAGGIIGVLYTSPGFGAFAGPTLAGWVYDEWHSYDPVIVLFAVCGFIAGGMMMMLKKPEAHPAYGGP
jgi:MFS family permease